MSFIESQHGGNSPPTAPRRRKTPPAQQRDADESDALLPREPPRRAYAVAVAMTLCAGAMLAVAAQPMTAPQSRDLQELDATLAPAAAAPTPDEPAAGAPTPQTPDEPAAGAPTPQPTKRGSKKKQNHDVPDWAQGLLIALFVVFIVLPCLIGVNHVFIQRKPPPNFGEVWTCEWYDERRGYLMLFTLFATFFNIAVLFFAALAYSDDANAMLSFSLALIQARKRGGKRDGLFIGLQGYTYARGTKGEEFYEFGESRPNDDIINYDYEWQGPCRRFGLAAFYLLVFAGAAKALAIVAFYRRAYVVLDTRQGNNRITDTPFWRWAGAVTEFACFCAMLGLTIQFYSTCWSYFPSAGNRMFFPVKDFTEEQRIAGTYPYTSAILCRNQNVTARPCSTSTPSTRRLLDGVAMPVPHRSTEPALVDFHTGAICISISAVLSLAISVIHFRMPCWEAETKDPEWFY